VHQRRGIIIASTVYPSLITTTSTTPCTHYRHYLMAASFSIAVRVMTEAMVVVRQVSRTNAVHLLLPQHTTFW
jgi:hypothetical protein